MFVVGLAAVDEEENRSKQKKKQKNGASQFDSKQKQTKTIVKRLDTIIINFYNETNKMTC